VLERYGNRFLPPGESRSRKRIAKLKYFLFLGKSALQIRGKAFWEYHKAELDALGWGWSWALVFGWSLVAALTLFLNPLSTTMQILRRLRARLPGVSQPS
jgi:hypothetical protein